MLAKISSITVFNLGRIIFLFFSRNRIGHYFWTPLYKGNLCWCDGTHLVPLCENNDILVVSKTLKNGDILPIMLGYERGREKALYHELVSTDDTTGLESINEFFSTFYSSISEKNECITVGNSISVATKKAAKSSQVESEYSN